MAIHKRLAGASPFFSPPRAAQIEPLTYNQDSLWFNVVPDFRLLKPMGRAVRVAIAYDR